MPVVPAGGVGHALCEIPLVIPAGEGLQVRVGHLHLHHGVEHVDAVVVDEHRARPLAVPCVHLQGVAQGAFARAELAVIGDAAARLEDLIHGPLLLLEEELLVKAVLALAHPAYMGHRAEEVLVVLDIVPYRCAGVDDDRIEGGMCPRAPDSTYLHVEGVPVNLVIRRAHPQVHALDIVFQILYVFPQAHLRAQPGEEAGGLARAAYVAAVREEVEVCLLILVDEVDEQAIQGVLHRQHLRVMASRAFQLPYRRQVPRIAVRCPRTQVHGDEVPEGGLRAVIQGDARAYEDHAIGDMLVQGCQAVQGGAQGVLQTFLERVPVRHVAYIMDEWVGAPARSPHRLARLGVGRDDVAAVYGPHLAERLDEYLFPAHHRHGQVALVQRLVGDGPIQVLQDPRAGARVLPVLTLVTYDEHVPYGLDVRVPC